MSRLGLKMSKEKKMNPLERLDARLDEYLKHLAILYPFRAMLLISFGVGALTAVITRLLGLPTGPSLLVGSCLTLLLLVFLGILHLLECGRRLR